MNIPAKCVGLLIHEGKPAALEAARLLADALSGRGIRLIARDSIAQQFTQDKCIGGEDTDIADADFVVVFGGDGTLLAAARLLAPFGTPILGIHLGHFGFITEVAPENLIEAVEKTMAGDCEIEERMMLHGVLKRVGGYEYDIREETLFAMNDIVVASGAVRMIHLRTRVGGEPLATYAADGVIVATPTGSTGYSLSANGPLVHPSAPVLIVNPISPHTLSARTLIVPDSEVITLNLEEPIRSDAFVSVDGQLDVPFYGGDTLTISRAPFNARIVTVGGPSFYQKIRSRWHYGEREAW